MRIVDILECIKKEPGSNAKKDIMKQYCENDVFKKVLKYSLDPFVPFHIVKVPKVKNRTSSSATEAARWTSFFDVADLCANRSYTGNTAIAIMSDVFSVVPADEEKWMRKILKKHLAIGVSIKTANKVFPKLVPTFDVALAQKFDAKRIDAQKEVFVEPKLDGIRCFSIVRDSNVQMFARSGKLITNFEDNIAPELVKLGDGCYDGELMGNNFTDLMRQAYRKENVDTKDTYLSLFDYLPLDEWDSKNTKLTCDERQEQLLDKLADDDSIDLSLLQPVERSVVAAKYDLIKECHDEYVSQGYEGAMIKLVDAPYKFGRGFEVMKLKAFHDEDLEIKGLLEGTGKHEGKLGSVVVNYKGVDVNVGSGFCDELRDKIWKDSDAFIGKVIEVRYQEVTPDGSLRFPTFVCFRNDR